MENTIFIEFYWPTLAMFVKKIKVQEPLQEIKLYVCKLCGYKIHSKCPWDRNTFPEKSRTSEELLLNLSITTTKPIKPNCHPTLMISIIKHENQNFPDAVRERIMLILTQTDEQLAHMLCVDHEFKPDLPSGQIEGLCQLQHVHSTI